MPEYKYSHLNRNKYYALRKWSESNVEMLKSMADEHTAAVASAAIGFPVTGPNIQSVRLDLGLRKTGGRRLGRSGSNSSRDLAREIIKLVDALKRTFPGLEFDLSDRTLHIAGKLAGPLFNNADEGVDNGR